jgi:hypothetical protein
LLQKRPKVKSKQQHAAIKPEVTNPVNAPNKVFTAGVTTVTSSYGRGVKDLNGGGSGQAIRALAQRDEFTNLLV